MKNFKKKKKKTSFLLKILNLKRNVRDTFFRRKRKKNKKYTLIF